MKSTMCSILFGEDVSPLARGESLACAVQPGLAWWLSIVLQKGHFTLAIRSNPGIRRVGRLVKQSSNAIKFRLAGSDLHVAFVNSAIGMFAQMNFCLYMARYAERSGQRLHITLNSENYLDPDRGPNWFDYYFFHNHREPPPKRRHIEISNNSQLPLTWDGLTLVEANRIFFSQFGIRSEIVDAVDTFVRNNDIGEHTIGVHYRGTDKHTEATPVGIADALTKIRSMISSSTNARNLFFASDSAEFIKAAREQIVDVPTASLDDSVRSDGTTPLHLGGSRAGNYAMGRDALLNALVLSKCGSMIRTTSFLSAWSSIFNPSIPVALLNRPYAKTLWFPEAVIVPKARML